MSDKTHELLPPGTPRLMRDVLRALPFDATIDPATDSVRNIKANPPGSFLPWLLHELSLSQFSRFVPDARELYEIGRELNRVKGTKRAIRIVGEWFGYTDLEIRTHQTATVHFPEFELGLDRFPDKATDLCDLLDAINRVKPLRSRFRRVWRGMDIPFFIPSHSPWGHLLSDSSGVHSRDLGLCISPGLCREDLRISFRVEDSECSVAIEVTVGDAEDIIVQDYEHVRDSFNLPVPSQDFGGMFYPSGFGTIGEHEMVEDNSGYLFDGNADWPNLDWINDSWIQPCFSIIGENDTYEVVEAEHEGGDDGQSILTDDEQEIALD